MKATKALINDASVTA